MNLLINNEEIVIPRRVNYKDQFCGMDTPGFAQTNIDWRKTYPVQDFDYQFNSWGFRGPEYSDYIGKEVILCLGDSIVTNIGGPIKHSWPCILQRNFNIPCLNFGVEGAGNDAIRLVYDRACKIFNVRYTFVVYTFLHRRLEDNQFKSEPHDFEDNIKHFEKNFIKGAIFNFIPPTGYSIEELKYIDNLASRYINYNYKEHRTEVDKNRKCYVDKEHYNNLKGADWPSYKEFINGMPPHPNMLTDNFNKFVNQNLWVNRDGWHLTYYANKLLTQNLYKQWKVLTQKTHYE
jgi:hypothetical protein